MLGLAFFVLTVLAMLGFYYGIEFAQAVFLLMAPMSHRRGAEPADGAADRGRRDRRRPACTAA